MTIQEIVDYAIQRSTERNGVAIEMDGSDGDTGEICTELATRGSLVSSVDGQNRYEGEGWAVLVSV